MAEWGISGLAVSSGADLGIQQLRYKEYADAQARGEAQAKAKLFAQDFDFEQGMNPWDDKLAKDHAYQKLNELREYYKSNPDADYNPIKQIEVQKIKKDVKTNPITVRGLQVKQAYQEYLKDRAEALKTPQSWDMEALDEEGKKFENYFKTGHWAGQDGYEKDGGPQPVVYTRPEMFLDENDLFMKTGSKIQAKGVRKLNNGRLGAHEVFATDMDVQATAEALYTAHKRQFDQRYAKQGLDPIKEIAEKIRPYTPYKLDYGQEDILGRQMALEQFKAKLKASQGGAAGGSAYDYSILNTDKAVPGAEFLAETFGTTPTAHYRSPKGELVKVSATDAWHYEGELIEKGYGTKNYRRTGVKQAPGYVLKPLDWAYEQGYLHDPWGFSGSGETDLEVRPDYKDFVQVIDTPPGKDGNTRKVVKIGGVAELNANTAMYRSRFDANVAKMTSGQRDDSGVQESTLQKQPVAASREAFKQAGYSDAQIEAGVRRGLIILQ